MKKRSTIGAIVIAGVLSLAATNVALAVVLNSEFEAMIAGWDASGDPFAEDSGGDPIAVNTDECDGIDIAEGEIAFLFVQSGDAQDPTVPNGGGTAGNTLDVDLNDGEIFLADEEASDVLAESVEWLITVEPRGLELELVSATSNVDGGDLVVAAICIAVAAKATGPDTASDAPTNTAPSDRTWLLLIGLGGFLASVVFLTPARTRSRVRRPSPQSHAG